MFIVLDAIDGAGKGRQREELTAFLKSQGYSVESAEFPIHDQFYEYVVHPALQGETKMNASSWVLAYLLDKTRQAEKIKPFLSTTDTFYIADGYFTTTIAYQSLLMEQIELNRLLDLGVEFDIPVPNLAVYLDVDPKVAMQRKQKEEGHEEGPDMFEGSIKKQQKLRSIFNKMVDEEIYCDWERVDGSGTIEQVTENIINILRTKSFISDGSKKTT